MDHTLKLGPPPSKTSYLKLFPLLLLVCVVCCSSGTPQVSKTIKDVARLSCDYNVSTLELTMTRIYWQKQNSLVLTVTDGIVRAWNKYENRTFPIFDNNHSIVILGLRLSDNGNYDCIIQQKQHKNGSYKVKHRTSVKLLVNAYFPVPNIIDLGHISPKTRRICCSTSGGYPKPQLSWLENGEELNASNMTVSQDPETKLYTISSELDFNVTNNHNFTCLVKYGGLKVSQTFNFQKFDTNTGDPSLNWHIIYYVLLAAALVVALIGFITCCVYIHNASQRRARRNNEAMEIRGTDPSTPGPANHQTA